VIWNGIKGFQCIFQSIFVDFFTVELALPFVEKSFIESNLSYEKTAHSETKSRYDSYKISENENRTFISERLSARYLELSEMEETIKKYKQRLCLV
jgi:hypothetical protein